MSSCGRRLKRHPGPPWRTIVRGAGPHKGLPMKCLRIYADETGASLFADIDIPLVSMELFRGVPAISLSAWFTATAVRFAWVPGGMRVADWHTTPVRQLV